MRIHVRRDRPEPWPERRAKARHAWTVPFVCFEYGTGWLAYALNRWTFVEVLEYLGSFGILIAVIFYFAESGDRINQADLRRVNLDGLKSKALRSVKGTDLHGVQNAPTGFLTWAFARGASTKPEEP